MGNSDCSKMLAFYEIMKMLETIDEAKFYNCKEEIKSEFKHIKKGLNPLFIYFYAYSLFLVFCSSKKVLLSLKLYF